jgi:hypothetical protein
MEKQFEVDIDKEQVCFEGEWLDTKGLAEKIRRMIDSQDFRIGMAGVALEYLQKSVSNAREFAIKLAPDDAELLEAHAGKAKTEIPAFIRQAIRAYLAAQPPLEQGSSEASQMTTITTEPARPEEEQNAVELTELKQQASSKVLVDPSLSTGQGAKGVIEGSWFNKK